MANTAVNPHMPTPTILPLPPQIAALPSIELVEDFKRTQVCVPGYATSTYGKLRRAMGRGYLQRNGWRVVGALPDVPRVVLVCAPHTSNWDFAMMVALMRAVDIDPVWVGKDTLFRPPFGKLTQALGGIAVQRGAKANQSQMIADALQRFDQCMLAIAPEGTRRLAKRWKSGFWHIAKAAKVPIVLGFLDYNRKLIGFGPIIEPGETIEADFGQIEAFYAGVLGKFAAQQGPITLQAQS